MNDQPAKSTRPCIFCGTGKQSGEHIHSGWLHEHLDQIDSRNRVETSSRLFYGPNGIDMRRQERKRINEKTISYKAPGPCTDCNNGWMSNDLEKPVKDVLLPLVLGKGASLPSGAVSKLVEWLLVKIICIDYDGGIPLFTQEEREAFYLRRAIPSAVICIWAIPLVAGAPWGASWERMGGTNAATFTFGVGQVLFYVWCDRDLQVSIDEERIAGGRAQRIWPLRPLNAWPPLRSYLSNAGAEQVSQALDVFRQISGTPISGPKPVKKLRIPKNPTEGAIHVVIQKDTFLLGNDYVTHVCGGCEEVLLRDLAVETWRDTLPATSQAMSLICPHCGAHNILPLKRLKAGEAKTE